MDAAKPRTRVLRVGCAPNRFPCPHLWPGLADSSRLHTPRVRDIAYRGDRHHRADRSENTAPPLLLLQDPSAHRSRASRPVPPTPMPVRAAVIDRVLDDGMSMQRPAAGHAPRFPPRSLRRLPLRLPRLAGAATDLADYRR